MTLRNRRFCQLQSHVTQKLGRTLKIQQEQIKISCSPSLRIRGQLPARIVMAKEIAFENGRISAFEGLVTFTLDWVILHTIVHKSSTSTYMPNFTEIKKSFVDKQKYVRRTDI